MSVFQGCYPPNESPSLILKVLNFAGNLAYFQPATQSATSGLEQTCGASLAVDDSLISKACAKNADILTPAWWQVDLGALKSVASVWLLDRNGTPLQYYLSQLSESLSLSCLCLLRSQFLSRYKTRDRLTTTVSGIIGYLTLLCTS